MIGQPRQALFGEPPPPLAHRHPGHPSSAHPRHPDPGSAHASTIRARSASHGSLPCDQRQAQHDPHPSAPAARPSESDIPPGYRLNPLISGAATRQSAYLCIAALGANIRFCRISRVSSSMSDGAGSKIGLEVMPITGVTLSDGYGPGGRAPTRLLMDGLEVGWLAVRSAPEWSLWLPRGRVSPLRGRRGVGGDWADGKVPVHAGQAAARRSRWCGALLGDRVAAVYDQVLPGDVGRAGAGQPGNGGGDLVG